MSGQSRRNSTRQDPRTHASALSDLSPFSTLACQVEATNTWRKDLKTLFSRASERFADVSWTPGDNEDENLTDEESISPFQKKSASSQEGVIWAHKAILYARAPNTFQARFLLLRPAAANLGAMASSSTVSLPMLRAPSPSMSLASRKQSSVHSTKRRTIRGVAPPSSFSMSRVASKGSTYTTGSDSETDEGVSRPRGSKRNSSTSSLASSNISRPFNRNEQRLSRQISFDSMPNASSPSLASDSDALSILSAASTVKAPMSLDGVNQVFFEATLEYLYTAEESMKEAFEFLYEDRVAADEGPEVRLEKLRQDLVFMWRSRLYADIEIVIGDEDERATVRTIPDINASVLSLVPSEAAEEEEEETATFSAHRMMLVSRSPYFAAQLLSPYSDANTRMIRLPSPPFTPAALHFTLGFIYTGTLFFSNRTFDLSTAFQLWRSASYLQIDTLSTLVASLITHDFCHGFACSPPCKTCIKRVPRTLAFVSCPDVNDAHMQALARRAISGDDFGSYWSKEVGNLDYAVRGVLVSDICARIDGRPGYAIHALRQVSIVGTRIDTERNSRWVDALRWMCETVESHVRAIMEARLAEVIASSEWLQLVEGVGFLNDILEKALSIIVDGLSERRAAKVYEILVGQVLLREEGLPSQDIVAMVEQARKDIVLYLRKRWVNVRANAGFNGIGSWALKELADEIDVPTNDLLVQGDKTALSAGSGSRTEVRNRSLPGGASVSESVARFNARSNAGQMVDGEREAGPIHLRAAVLNRNAARSSAVNGFRSTSHSSSPPPRDVGEGSSMINRPRHSAGPTGSSPTSSGKASNMVAARTGPLRQASVTAERRSSLDGRGESSSSQPPVSAAGPSSPILPGSARTSNWNKTPTASLRSVATSLASQDNDELKRKPSSTSISAVRSNASQKGRVVAPPPTTGQSGGAAGVRKSTSKASLRAVPSSSNVLAESSPHSTMRSVRSRQSSVSSAVSTSAASLRKASATPSTPSPATKTIRKVPSIKSAQKRREEIAVPPLPHQSSLVLKEIAPNLSAARGNGQREAKEARDASATSSDGTHLSSGIPCVIAPRNKLGRVTRFRAVVKYIGTVKKEGDVPIVGVEVALPLPIGVEERDYDFHDGAYRGIKYFDIGQVHRPTDAGHELSHKPEREARRLRLEQMMQGRPQADPSYGSQGEDARASAKRRKEDFTGATLDLFPQGSRGLFVQPCEVLWVVI